MVASLHLPETDMEGFDEARGWQRRPRGCWGRRRGGIDRVCLVDERSGEKRARCSQHRGRRPLHSAICRTHHTIRTPPDIRREPIPCNARRTTTHSCSAPPCRGRMIEVGLSIPFYTLLPPAIQRSLFSPPMVISFRSNMRVKPSDEEPVRCASSRGP